MTGGAAPSARTDPRPFNPDGRPYFDTFDPACVPSPCFVIDRAAVRHNLAILREVADRAGAVLLGALKAFSGPCLFDLFRASLDGVAASGYAEARLGREEMGPAALVHTSGPAYPEADLERLLELTDHLVFNSLGQWLRARDRCLAARRTRRDVRFGLRVNPDLSVGRVPIYDPAAPYSRLGTTREALDADTRSARSGGVEDPLHGLTELHMHVLCEDGADALERVVAALEQRFGDLLADARITGLNLGGGHHITKPGYDRDRLISIVSDLRRRYAVEVLLEPGEALVIHSGILVTTVLDVGHNGMPFAILDTSATNHMPDTLEMPYRPDIWGAADPGAAPYTVRLGGSTCLAGDVFGDYSFDQPLLPGDRLVFDDMTHYTMVKTTTFNGLLPPAIATWDSGTSRLAIVRTPGYHDFRDRLG